MQISEPDSAAGHDPQTFQSARPARGYVSGRAFRNASARLSYRGLLLLLLLLCGLRGSAASAQDGIPPLFDSPLSFGSAISDDAKPELVAALQHVDEHTVVLNVTLTLPAGFYTYSMSPDFGARTEITLAPVAGFTPDTGGWKADRPPESVMDPYLEQRVEKYHDAVTWSHVFRASQPIPADLEIRGELTGQYCGSGESGVCKQIDPPMTFAARLPEGTGAVLPAVVPQRSPAQVTIIPELRHDESDPTPPVSFDVSLSPTDAATGDEVTLTVTARLGSLWHIYAVDQDPSGGGGTPTEITLFETVGLKPVDEQFQPVAPPTVKNEFGIVQRAHYGEATWQRRYVLTDSVAAVEGGIVFQLCTERNCLAPTEVEFEVGLASAGSPPPSPSTSPDMRTDRAVGNSGETVAAAEFSSDDPRARGLLFFVLSAFGAGALALLTPCVFPMIPVTVAFFLKQSEKNHGNAVVLAVVYSIAIIVAFTFLGVFVAAVFGSQALTEAANNPWLNLFFAVLFIAFGLSLMGLFELRIPSFLLTWSSKKESTGGLAGVMFMALTFTLVSFTCTFAFLGPILVWAAKGELFWPVIGMFSFSTAFAAPFFVLALFPSLLKALPKGGGWLNAVKVTMAFVEFALVLKFLSVADIALSATGMPYWIDTQGFLACWTVLAGIIGMYLLGIFRMHHDLPVDGVSPIRCLFACGFLCLAAYLGVGTYGQEKPKGWLWEQVVAFAPPEFSVERLTVVHGDLTWHLDLEAAVRESTENNKPLFIDFTGVNCVNCRKMEKTVLNRDAVVERLASCVRAQLFVDVVPIADKGLAEQLLESNKRLQRDWFGDVTMPAYAVVSADGETLLAKYKNLDTTGGVEFRRFLDAGIQRWSELRIGQVSGGRTVASDDRPRK